MAYYSKGKTNKKLNNDYVCNFGFPVLHGEIKTEYGTFVYRYDKYIGRKSE